MKRSVIVPVYNNSGTLNRAIASIAGQSCFPDLSVFISDDASTDQSLAIAIEWSVRHPNIKVVANSDNVGVMGNYVRLSNMLEDGLVFLLEADDRWTDPLRIEILSNYFRGSKQFGLFSNYEIVTMTQHGERRSMGGSNRFQLITAVQIIHRNLPASFSNCAYHVNAFKDCLDVTKNLGGYDWLFNVIFADMYDGLGYHPRKMSEYYSLETGTWLSTPAEQRSRIESSNLKSMIAHLKSPLARQVARDSLLERDKSKTAVQV